MEKEDLMNEPLKFRKKMQASRHRRDKDKGRNLIKHQQRSGENFYDKIGIIFRNFTGHDIKNISSFNNFTNFIYKNVDAASLGICRMLFGK